MKKENGADEKKILDVVNDYSEELERIIQNPELLASELYEDEIKENTVNGSRHHSRHSAHRSGSHHHPHHYNSLSTYNGTGRLASHHRSRHHHKIREKEENQEKSEASQKTVNKEIEYFQEPVQLRNKDNDNKNIAVIQSENYDFNTEKQTETGASTNNNYSLKNNGKVVNRSRRIASKASGSEKDKREAERAIETNAGRGKKRKLKRRRQNRKKRGFFSVFLRILSILLAINIAAVGVLVYLRAVGEKSMKKPIEDVKIVVPREDPEIEEVEDDGKTIVYKGEKYGYNDNISTILFMGTDRTKQQQEETETTIGNNGQADTIILCVIDNTNQKISYINVNRDTMTPVSEYTPDGDYAGDKLMQICLAYSYGADNTQSSKRMVEAVSKYLYGIPINAYCRMSYDGIPILNDAIGGVTVKIPEDMSSVYPEWVKGSTITLHGNDATRYVRWRDTTTVHTNELRMSRQKQYLKAYIKQTINQVKEDLTLPITLFSIVMDYITTDITTSQITYLSFKAIQYGIDDNAIISIPGKSIDGEEHVEFYTDETGMYEVILKTFYNKV